MTELPTGYEFTADRSRMDRETIHRWLSEHAYWALGRTRELQDAAIDGSLNFGVFGPDGTQVAYARVVTDGATFAWFCDVFVDPSARGLGVGKALTAGVLSELDGLGIGRTLLATSSAHELYRPFGFAQIEPAENWMIKVRAGQFMPGKGGGASLACGG